VNLKEMQELSVLQTKTGPKNAKLYLEKIRKNLMTLMCQTDVIELSGDLNAFGGDKDVTANISKAVFGLFCLGNILGIDVSQGVEKLASDTRERLTSVSRSSCQADLWTTEKKDDTEPNTSSAQENDSGADSKAKKIENYRNALRNPRDRAAIDLVWKSISEDKELNGQDKYQLQNEKKEALKRVAA